MSFIPKSIKKIKKRKLLAFFIFISIAVILFSGYGFVEKSIDLKILLIILFALAIIQVFVLQYFFKNQLKNDLIKTKLYERLDHLNKNLEQANEIVDDKSIYLANISYEIRTPLSTVLGMLDMLRQTDLEMAQKAQVDVAEYSSKHILQLVNMITDNAEFDPSDVKLNLLALDLKSDLSYLFKIFEYQTWDIGLDFESKFLFEDNSKFSVLADSARIQQVLINLINNAIKYTDFGKISVIVDQTVGIDDDQIVTFYVKDTGVGMSNDEVDQFYKNTKTSNTTSSKDHRGLGLSISRQLVKLMGGELKVESKENEGSIFYFSLQLKKTLNIKAEQIENTPTLHKKFNVLVAEDNFMNQKVIKFLLEKQGADCTFAKNGLEALELYKILDFDMIFMDIYMPDMDGYQATKAIKKTEKYLENKTPIIGVSASAFEKDIEYAKLAGIDEFLSKPIEVIKLKGLLVKYADKENFSA